MGFISKTTIGAALICCSIYVASPYYAGYQMFQAIKTGSEEGMTKYIDFVSVRDSIKQQVDTSIEQNSSGDPLTNSMIKAFRPMIDKIVDEMVAPDKLAAFIKTGDLKQASRQRQKDNKEQDSAETLSWYAFFDRINRFRVSVDKLVLYMEFRDFQWKLVALGSSDFLDFSKGRSKKSKQHVADEIDENPAPIPQAYSDLNSIKKRYADSFFITGDYSTKFVLEGDLFFLSSNSKPTLVAFEGYDRDGNVVTRDSTEAEKEQKAKYSYFYNGSWREDIHKISSDLKIHELQGRLQIDVPTGIESYQLNADDKGKLQKKSVTAVTLTDISNGSVGLSLYKPYDKGEKEFVLICRNKDGQRLKTSGHSWGSPIEPITLPGIQSEYKARHMTLRVSGTPHSVEVYYVHKDEKVEIDFTAYQKPEVSFGQLKSPIRRTRYVAPKSEPEPELLEMSKADLDGITYEYKQEVGYDGKERRFLHFILPKKSNTYFAKADYSGIKLSLNNQNVDFKVNKEHSGQTNFKVLFSQPNNEWGESVKLDKIGGKVVFRYPVKIEKKTIKQGENKNGISLMGHNFYYSKGSSVLPYSSVWPVVAARAYDEHKREIALLDSSIRGRNENNITFWGSPAYVEYKVANEWLTLEFDINKTKDDMVIVEK